MNIEDLIKELERLKTEKYSYNTSMNIGYRVAIMDAIELLQKFVNAPTGSKK